MGKIASLIGYKVTYFRQNSIGNYYSGDYLRPKVKQSKAMLSKKGEKKKYAPRTKIYRCESSVTEEPILI